MTDKLEKLKAEFAAKQSNETKERKKEYEKVLAKAAFEENEALKIFETKLEEVFEARREFDDASLIAVVAANEARAAVQEEKLRIAFSKLSSAEQIKARTKELNLIAYKEKCVANEVKEKLKACLSTMFEAKRMLDEKSKITSKAKEDALLNPPHEGFDQWFYEFKGEVLGGNTGWHQWSKVGLKFTPDSTLRNCKIIIDDDNEWEVDDDKYPEISFTIQGDMERLGLIQALEGLIIQLNNVDGLSN